MPENDSAHSFTTELVSSSHFILAISRAALLANNFPFDRLATAMDDSEETDHYRSLLSHKSPAIFPPERRPSTSRTSLYTPPVGLYAESGSGNSPILARRLYISPRPGPYRVRYALCYPCTCAKFDVFFRSQLRSVSSLLSSMTWSRYAMSVPGDHRVQQ